MIAVKKDTNLSFIYQDHLGSTSITADTSGTITSTSKQMPYGAARLTSGALPTDYLFTGQKRDIATAGSELYYYGARYYDPQIGRFISADSIVPHPGNPQSLNRYSYCLNNPLRYNDPTGHWPDWGDVGQFCLGFIQSVANTVMSTFETLDRVQNDPIGLISDTVSAAIHYEETWNSIKSYYDPSTPIGQGRIAGDVALTAAITIATAGAGGAAEATVISSERASTTALGIATSDVAAPSVSRGLTLVENGFDSLKQLKNSIGSAGEGNDWHHIVEQCQISKSGFDPKLIQNPDNMLVVDEATHAKISGYYNSIPRFTSGQRVRNWLAGQSFSDQYNFGLDVLKRFGY